MPSNVVLQQPEGVDIENLNRSCSLPLITSPPPSTTSSLYTHPFGRVGQRKHSGIFVVFPDNGSVVFHLIAVLEDGIDEVSGQQLRLATMAFRCDHVSG